MELERAGVLKLVHQHQIQFVPQGVAHVVPLQQTHRQRLLIGEVDHSRLCLDPLVPLAGAGRNVEHGAYVSAELAPELRPTVVAGGAGRQWLEDGVGPGALRRRGTRQLVEAMPVDRHLALGQGQVGAHQL